MEEAERVIAPLLRSAGETNSYFFLVFLFAGFLLAVFFFATFLFAGFLLAVFFFATFLFAGFLLAVFFFATFFFATFFFATFLFTTFFFAGFFLAVFFFTTFFFAAFFLAGFFFTAISRHLLCPTPRPFARGVGRLGFLYRTSTRPPARSRCLRPVTVGDLGRRDGEQRNT